MKNLILWSMVLAFYFIYTFPPFECSKHRVVQSMHALLNIVLCAVIGYGLGTALADVL